jgi:hypothetical protein
MAEQSDNRLDAGRAKEAAQSALTRETLATQEPFASLGKTTHPIDPILVTYLPPTRGETFLVPFIQQDNPESPSSMPLIVRVEPHSGDYQGAIGFPGGSAFLASMISQEAAIERVTSPNGVPDPKTGRVYHPKREDLQPGLYWRPCGESPSVYWPFYYFIVEGQGIFVRGDGEVFVGLTDVYGA